MIKMVMLMDLHWGAIDPARMKQELDKTLFEKLRSNKVDIIFIGGDLFDSKQYFTSEVVRYVIEFLIELSKYTQYIVCIQGTRTHDDLQLETLKAIFTKLKLHDYDYNFDEDGFYPCEFLFFDKPAIIKLYDSGETHQYYENNTAYEMEYVEGCPDATYQYDQDHNTFSILCIPEEYVLDQNDYYGKYLNDRFYDMIVFHGMVDKIWFAQKNKENQTNLTKHLSAPVFKVDELLQHCHKCYAGHVHLHKYYGLDDRFLYVGPYTRWEFSKEDDVGFEYVEYENGKFKDAFIVNKNAQILTTRVLNINESISLSDLNDKLDGIIAKEMTSSDKLRFIINLKSNIDRYLEIKDFLISKLGEIKFVKLVLSIDVGDEYMEMTKEQLEENRDEKNYLFESMDLEERIRVFLKQKKGLDISIDDIKSILKMEV